jgi:pimeloyl-ACP methyl ester carboxylesterase
MTDALADLRAEDLLAVCLDAVSIAAQTARHVDVLGISAGGAICAWLAARVEIDTAIAIAPLFGVIVVPGYANDLLPWLARALSNTFVWWDPIRQEQQLPLHAYPRFSTRALGQTLDIAATAARVSPGGAHGRRLVLVLNRRDPIVNNQFAKKRAEQVGKLGVEIDVVEPRGLPFQHDIIEPTLPRTPVGIIYPLLRGLIGREREAAV